MVIMTKEILFNNKPMEFAWGSHEPDSSGFISWGYEVKFKNVSVTVSKGWDQDKVYNWSVGFGGGYESAYEGEADSPQKAADDAYNKLEDIRCEIHDMIR